MVVGQARFVGNRPFRVPPPKNRASKCELQPHSVALPISQNFFPIFPHRRPGWIAIGSHAYRGCVSDFILVRWKTSAAPVRLRDDAKIRSRIADDGSNRPAFGAQPFADFEALPGGPVAVCEGWACQAYSAQCCCSAFKRGPPAAWGQPWLRRTRMLSGAVGCLVSCRRHRRLIWTRAMKGWVGCAPFTSTSSRSFRGLG
jgi:hypothetical protein